jgi:hypothetical protein
MRHKRVSMVVMASLVCLAARPAGAGEPGLTRASVRKAVALAAVQAEARDRGPRNGTMTWSGVAMLGGATLAVVGARPMVGPGHVGIARIVRFPHATTEPLGPGLIRAGRPESSFPRGRFRRLDSATCH